ncbi:universal stress protein [Altererythrobacter sp. MF3-039]|uniref:universal stress protein n=1 Tax=Altererythrobacter sp. MF3-039 TaxID=3252901 RepID=UPI00390CACA1
MRVYLVVMDETEEARKAVRFATRRSAKTGGSLHILAIVQQQNFNAFGGVQATIEQEARERAEMLAANEAGNIQAEGGRIPQIAVRSGDGQKIIRDYLSEHDEVAALVLGAAEVGNPGPLVTQFASDAGDLPCPVYIVPGGLSDERLDELA